MSDAFAPFEAVLADREAAARAFKAAGGKVVGYLGNTAPVELIAAAGAFPLRLVAQTDATPLADRYMEDLFDPVVRAVFEKMLAGGYGFLDAVVLPRTSDSIQRLYYYLCEIRRMGEADVPEPLLYDLLHTPWYSSAEYNYARTLELKSKLEGVTGGRVTEEALAAAIAVANRRRARLDALVALRRTAPHPGITGVAAQQVFAASQVMAPDAFEAALTPVLEGSQGSLPGMRIVLAGSGQTTPALHALIESLGAVVVGDFQEYGELMIGPPVPQEGSALRALTEHYHRGVISSRTFPQDPTLLLDFARAAGAEGVIFYFFFEEEALTWEYPAERRALHSAGIATLCLENMPARPDVAAIRGTLAGFIEGLQVGVMP